MQNGLIQFYVYLKVEMCNVGWKERSQHFTHTREDINISTIFLQQKLTTRNKYVLESSHMHARILYWTTRETCQLNFKIHSTFELLTNRGINLYLRKKLQSTFVSSPIK